ncbi:MAG: VanW family protein [Patescibacteria group bacterium]
MAKKQEKRKIPSSLKKTGKILLLVFVLFVSLPLIALGTYSALNANHIYANQYVGEINLAKRTRADATAILTKMAGDYNALEIPLQYRFENEERSYSIKPAEIGVHFDIEATVNELWQVGRDDNFDQAMKQQARSIFRPTVHQMVYRYNEEALASKIRTLAKELEIPEKDFSLYYKNGRFGLTVDREPGRRIPREEIISRIKTNIGGLKTETISFSSQASQPAVLPEKAEARLAEANRIIESGDLVLEHESQSFTLDNETIGGLIKSKTNGDNLEIYFDDGRLNTFVNSIAAALNVDPVNARLKIEGGRATVFQTAQAGKTLDVDKTKSAVISALLTRIDDSAEIARPQKIALVVQTREPEIKEADIGNLGIVELVGNGVTDFKGSPSNRVHNIQTGAAALNGILLAPDETFSTLAKLGEISDKSGYLPELVIKENKTIPEFGGGLCQVSTTLFRAALNVGMEIVGRQNHKYRVSYYEPPVGMDATIYDPAPDFKFKNNYVSHILIQSKVEGTKITFEFYGTKDTRQVEIGEPETWGEVSPGNPVVTETDTLPPGERKQIEKAHAGISAKFHYKVSREGEILQETDFRSKYVPWPEKWLAGKQSTPPQQ